MKIVKEEKIAMCVECPYYEHIPVTQAYSSITKCLATGKELSTENLPLPDWCPLPDAEEDA